MMFENDRFWGYRRQEGYSVWHGVGFFGSCFGGGSGLGGGRPLPWTLDMQFLKRNGGPFTSQTEVKEYMKSKESK